MDSIPITVSPTPKEQILFTKSHKINRTMPLILGTSRNRMSSQNWNHFCDQVDTALRTLQKKKVILFIGWVLLIILGLFFKFGWNDNTSIFFPLVICGVVLFYINYSAHYHASLTVQKACMTATNHNKDVTMIFKGAFHGDDNDSNYVGDEDTDRIENKTLQALVVYLKRPRMGEHNKCAITNWSIEVAAVVNTNNLNATNDFTNTDNNNKDFSGGDDIDLTPLPAFGEDPYSANDAVVSSYSTPSFLQVDNGSAKKTQN
mmetsp:Transcript_57085/g.63817  ORF Transcript_57085/g.63817 Transcript_57085/m.63817 type:complete len:260 (-) Transcript_57085:92-871(-)